MFRRPFACLLVSVFPAVLGASCRPASASLEAGAEHEHDPASLTVFGEQLLLFMEYPHLVRGAPARFLAHLTVLETGEPVRSGKVTLEIGTARFAVAAPKREGLFVPEGSPTEAGTLPARLVVRSDQAQETLDLGQVVVHATAAEADEAAHAQHEDEPPDAVPFLLEPQWKVRLLLARAESRTLVERLVVPARVATPEGRSAVVSTSIGGRLMPPASGALARSGDQVIAGQVLGFVEPPLGAAELAQLHALDLEFDLRSLEVLRASAEAEARLRFAERERERIASLRTEGLSTQQHLEEVEQDLVLARAELDGASRAREALARLEARRGAAVDGDARAPVRLPLAAPIEGSVVEVLGVQGASLEPGSPLYRVLDASRVWIEGRVSEFDAALLRGAPAALARLPALPGRSVALSGVGGGPPYVGPEIDPDSRTLLVRYETGNADGELLPGMLAELHIATGARAAVVAIPITAVLVDQGIPTAYVMLAGELFQKRQLELGVEDGEWVEVVRGIERGERVATRGAYLVKLAALSPTSFGAGHAH